MVYADEASVKSKRVSAAMHLADKGTDSVLFIFASASSASALDEKRTNPKPRLRFVSRSLTTTCGRVSNRRIIQAATLAYGFFDGSKLLEAIAQGLIGRMPGQAPEDDGQRYSEPSPTLIHTQ